MCIGGGVTAKLFVVFALINPLAANAYYWGDDKAKLECQLDASGDCVIKTYIKDPDKSPPFDDIGADLLDLQRDLNVKGNIKGVYFKNKNVPKDTDLNSRTYEIEGWSKKNGNKFNLTADGKIDFTFAEFNNLLLTNKYDYWKADTTLDFYGAMINANNTGKQDVNLKILNLQNNSDFKIGHHRLWVNTDPNSTTNYSNRTNTAENTLFF
ncbi:Uncharacterised protein [Anaerobiospirillum thomasii]|nr:Uncharacterised protein [Anaerobiospirillum thomasii]